ncbi:PucR family transcriptional regulator [Nocardia sp. 004]|uniref:PucR family transcriptional regulator n=1 Tax=Nocardia sp. 004 TaxID=3385978 RepID=UPI0039A0051A
MDQHLLSSDVDTTSTPVPAAALRALGAASIRFFTAHGETDILRIAAESVAAVGSCRALGCYRSATGNYPLCPSRQAPPTDLDAQLRTQHGEGRIRLPGLRWGWAFPLRSRSDTMDTLVIGAEHEPSPEEILVLRVLAQLTGTALADIAPDEQTVACAIGPATIGEQRPATVLSLEHHARVRLARRPDLTETEPQVCQELLEALLSGIDNDSAFTRAEALGHDLHGEHYVVLVHGDDSAITGAVSAAAAELGLHVIQGRYADTVVLITDRRPDPGAVDHAIRAHLGTTPVVVGVSGRCAQPSDLVRCFDEARHAIDIRLRLTDSPPAADKLGFYRLITAARANGHVERFIREWLGTLLDYDRARRAELVHTLSQYLECGGNYDASAAALHIHRSTLRYRLGRIRELTGFDLRDVSTRFNLHAATLAWQFLSADCTTSPRELISTLRSDPQRPRSRA